MTGYYDGIRVVHYQGRRHMIARDASIGEGVRFCYAAPRFDESGWWRGHRSLGYGRAS